MQCGCSLNVNKIFEQSDETPLPDMPVWVLTRVESVVITVMIKWKGENLGSGVNFSREENQIGLSPPYKKDSGVMPPSFGLTPPLISEPPLTYFTGGTATSSLYISV